MSTPGSSMLAPGRRLRTGIVAAMAVSIPVVLWWQVVELDTGGVVIGMVAGSYFRFIRLKRTWPRGWPGS